MSLQTTHCLVPGCPLGRCAGTKYPSHGLCLWHYGVLRGSRMVARVGMGLEVDVDEALDENDLKMLRSNVP